MKKLRMVIAGLTAALFLAEGSLCCVPEVMAAGVPTAVKSLTVVKGGHKTIKVKGARIKSKVFKSTNTEIAVVNQNGRVTGKKGGTCKIKITVKYLKVKKAKKVSVKKLTVKVTVNKEAIPPQPAETLQPTGVPETERPSEPTESSNPVDAPDSVSSSQPSGSLQPLETPQPMETPPVQTPSVQVPKPQAVSDEDALKQIIEEQKAMGADISSDLYNRAFYKWTYDGKLESISWKNAQLKGTLSLSAFKWLKDVECCNNQLTGLDVSGCTLLKDLECYNNQLTELNISGCKVLEDLECYNNQLTELNVGSCVMLEDLECHNNKITRLDISGCKVLEDLECYNNELTELNVSGCMALEKLVCDGKVNLTGVSVHCSVIQY